VEIFLAKPEGLDLENRCALACVYPPKFADFFIIGYFIEFI